MVVNVNDWVRCGIISPRASADRGCARFRTDTMTCNPYGFALGLVLSVHIHTQPFVLPRRFSLFAKSYGNKQCEMDRRIPLEVLLV